MVLDLDMVPTKQSARPQSTKRSATSKGKPTT